MVSKQAAARECANCTTRRHPVKANGLCARCRYVQKKSDRADKEVPSEMIFGYKKECQRRLNTLRSNEQKRIDPSGLDVEHQIVLIATQAGVPKRKLTHFRGLAALINDYFRPEQKTALYGLLADIEENIPWAGIDWSRAVSESNRK